MKPIILVILDGWGINFQKNGNAIAQAKTPTINEVEKFYPSTSLQASGIAVGLPWNEAGNSEVGHLTLGAGRIIYQSLMRIVLAIQDGSFFKNPALLETTEHARKNNSCLHLIGLVSSGSVHSYIDHMHGLIDFAKKEKIEKVRLHVFTDGEDSPPNDALKFLPGIEKKLAELQDGKIATLIGRFYAMDRNRNWDRTKKAYNCLVKSEGAKYENPIQAIEDSYNKGLTDTFIEPAVIINKETQNPIGIIGNNDSVIFFNFRGDRARQLTRAFVDDNFNEFDRIKLENLCFVSMTKYEEGRAVKVAFPPIEVINHLTEVLSNANKKILKIAETEKYAHVTYFFNGGKEKTYSGEERILIPSTNIPHYDKYPEMAAFEITDRIIQEISKNKYDLIVVNYANPDMVSHTGNFQAAIKAVETIDNCLKSLLKIARENKCSLLVTADHGNAEELINPRTGELSPEHSTNPVPCYLVDEKLRKKEPALTQSEEEKWGNPQGILCDVSPTILKLMEIPQPEEMTGKSLLPILK